MIAASTQDTVRVAVYCRFSTDEQREGYSIEAQHTRYEREAASHPEWRTTYFDEPAKSAYTRDERARPMFRALMEDVRAQV